MKGDRAGDLCAGHVVVRRSQPHCGDAPSSRLVASPNLWPRHLRLFMRWLLAPQGSVKIKSRLTAALREVLVESSRSGGLLFRFDQGFFAFEVGRAAFPFFH